MMLDLNRLQEDVISLPEDVQQTIVEFVSFLKQKHQSGSASSPQPISFEDQPFVGMWSDRSKTQDSTGWVRQMRRQQWQK